MPTVEFEGQQHQFPDDVTPEEIEQTLAALPAKEQEAPKPPHVESETISRDEGVRKDKEGNHISYKDGDVITAGRGHQLNKEELKEFPIGTVVPNDTVKRWFKQDMEVADQTLTAKLEKLKVRVPDEVFSILLNMSFNLGAKGLDEFKNMWKAVEVSDWQEVSKQMLLNADGTGKSKWLKQVGNRAVRLADRMASIGNSKPDEEIPAE